MNHPVWVLTCPQLDWPWVGVSANSPVTIRTWPWHALTDIFINEHEDILYVIENARVFHVSKNQNMQYALNQWIWSLLLVRLNNCTTYPILTTATVYNRNKKKTQFQMQIIGFNELKMRFHGPNDSKAILFSHWNGQCCGWPLQYGQWVTGWFADKVTRGQSSCGLVNS